MDSTSKRMGLFKCGFLTKRTLFISDERRLAEVAGRVLQEIVRKWRRKHRVRALVWVGDFLLAFALREEAQEGKMGSGVSGGFGVCVREELLTNVTYTLKFKCW
jgi:hypothetical protein